MATMTAPGTPNCCSIVLRVGPYWASIFAPGASRGGIMRPENCSKLCRNTPWAWSREMTAGSGVMPPSPDWMARCEMPCAAASVLTPWRPARPEHALGVVAGDDRRIGGDAAESGLDGALRNALRRGFRLDALQPGSEVAAARRRGLCRCTNTAEQKQAASGYPFTENNTGSHVFPFQALRSETVHWVAIMMP